MFIFCCHTVWVILMYFVFFSVFSLKGLVDFIFYLEEKNNDRPTIFYVSEWIAFSIEFSYL